MLRGMSWRDFLGWVAYYQLEPFDEARADLRSATICALIANVNRDPKRRAKPYVPKDFLLNFEEEEKPKRQTWQQQKMIAQFVAAAMSPTPRKKKS